MRRVGIENHLCELNNFTKEGHDHDLVENPRYVYREAKVRTESRLVEKLEQLAIASSLVFGASSVQSNPVNTESLGTREIGYYIITSF